MLLRVLKIIMDPGFKEKVSSFESSLGQLRAAETSYFAKSAQYLAGSAVAFIAQIYLLAILAVAFLVSLVVSLVMLIPQHNPEFSGLEIFAVSAGVLLAITVIVSISAFNTAKRSRRVLSMYIDHWSSSHES